MQEDREKTIRDFCDIARRRGNVAWRSAVIEEDRKEFFRGKDLLRYCEKNPEALDGVCDTGMYLTRKRLQKHAPGSRISHNTAVTG